MVDLDFSIRDKIGLAWFVVAVGWTINKSYRVYNKWLAEFPQTAIELTTQELAKLVVLQTVFLTFMLTFAAGYALYRLGEPVEVLIMSIINDSEGEEQ